MLNVFFTIDVEIWCGGWTQLDEKFPHTFRRYIYGVTPEGDFGLPYQLRILNDHGLKSVCFVEPLFATCFGINYLSEIIELIDHAGHEVQLHLHPEWVTVAKKLPLGSLQNKRQHLMNFSKTEQTTLIQKGLCLIQEAGARRVNTFRAGSFSFNADTIYALAANGIPFDSSYNASTFGPVSNVMPSACLFDAIECEGVYEYPMTVFDDGTRQLRHTQITACSFAEMQGLLWQALERGYTSFIILSHSVELLNITRDLKNKIVVDRFNKLCAFLDKNRDSFNVCGFNNLTQQTTKQQTISLSSPIWRTGGRILEQAIIKCQGW